MHAREEQKSHLGRSQLIVILMAELLLMAAALYFVYFTSWSHIVERRGEAIVTSMAHTDISPVAASVGPSLKKAKEQVRKEVDETVWTTDSVNYRKGPSTSYDIAGTLGIYTSVKRTGVTYNKWSRVIINDEEYYIKSKFLTTETPIITEGGQKGEYQKYALSLLGNYGWADSEIVPLINLWNRESGWNPNSHNRSSGAHGIPQALPAGKMASEGSDYYTNGRTQIRWGLGYILRTYGSPSNAWAHFCSSGWY